MFDLAFMCRGPSPAHGGTRQIHDGVAAFGLRCGAHGIAKRCRDDGVTARLESCDKVASDESGCPKHGNTHDAVRPYIDNALVAWMTAFSVSINAALTLAAEPVAKAAFIAGNATLA